MASALLPHIEADELHRKVVEQTLKHVAIDVGAEADIDMQKSLNHTENPVGKRPLGS